MWNWSSKYNFFWGDFKVISLKETNEILKEKVKEDSVRRVQLGTALNDGQPELLMEDIEDVINSLSDLYDGCIDTAWVEVNHETSLKIALAVLRKIRYG